MSPYVHYTQAVTQVRLGLAHGDEAPAIAGMSRQLIEHGLQWSWNEERVERKMKLEPFVLPPGCSFAPRCAHARPNCEAAMPVLAETAGHGTRCLRVATEGLVLA